jgi:hypothetical protein
MPVHRWLVTRIPYSDRIRLAVESRHRHDPFYSFPDIHLQKSIILNLRTFRIRDNPAFHVPNVFNLGPCREQNAPIHFEKSTTLSIILL